MERLQKRAEKEVEEFNAGYDCGANGGNIDDEPADGITEDHWAIGFKAGCYDRLQAMLSGVEAVYRGDYVVEYGWNSDTGTRGYYWGPRGNYASNRMTWAGTDRREAWLAIGRHLEKARTA